MCQIGNCLKFQYDLNPNDEPNNNNKILNFFSFLYDSIIKLILEVFGAGGAIWGFTEYANIRTQENKHICQIITISVLIIFFIRWCILIINKIVYLNN